MPCDSYYITCDQIETPFTSFPLVHQLVKSPESMVLVLLIATSWKNWKTFTYDFGGERLDASAAPTNPSWFVGTHIHVGWWRSYSPKSSEITVYCLQDFWIHRVSHSIHSLVKSDSVCLFTCSYMGRSPTWRRVPGTRSQKDLNTSNWSQRMITIPCNTLWYLANFQIPSGNLT